MKKVYMSGLVGALVLFSGCGPSSSTSGTNVDTTSIATNTIQVVRGPILGAIVRDNNGAGRVAKSDGNGNYTFAGAITYPVVAMGGVIDIDRNGVVSPGDVRNDLNLTTNSGNVITMVTTYASKPETQTILNELAASLGISVTDLTTKTPLNSTAVEAMSNVLYKYAQDNNVTASSVASIKTEIANEHARYVSEGSSHASATEEKTLMSALASYNKVYELKDADIASEVQKLNDDYTTQYATAQNEYERENGDSEYGENSGTSSHNQGANCASCHGSSSATPTRSFDSRESEGNEGNEGGSGGEGGEHQFTSGATIFTKLNAVNGDSAKYANNYKIRLVSEAGTVINYNIGRGTANVYSSFSTNILNNFTAEVLNAKGVVVNKSATNSHNISRLDCNSCHTASGAGPIASPGRIVSFDYSGSLTTVASAVMGGSTSALPTTPTQAPVVTTPTQAPVVTTPTVVAKSFATDVMPILNNCVACHSTNSGRIFQVSTASSTYANVTSGLVDSATPDNSTLLQKGSNQLSHGGGNAIGSSTNYATIRDWIAQGANNN